MSYTYTNNKGFTYYLCQVNTKTGKTRYCFTREPTATPVENIPAGYQVEESVNGLISLVKTRPQLILPEELAIFETALKKHPQGYKYRAIIKNNQIVIYENLRAGAIDMFSQMDYPYPVPESLGRQFIKQHAQYSPIMRFILNDTENRTFIPQRWCFRGSIDDWIDVGDPNNVDALAKMLIPKLGTDEFYELF